MIINRSLHNHHHPTTNHHLHFTLNLSPPPHPHLPPFLNHHNPPSLNHHHPPSLNHYHPPSPNHHRTPPFYLHQTMKFSPHQVLSRIRTMFLQIKLRLNLRHHLPAQKGNTTPQRTSSLILNIWMPHLHFFNLQSMLSQPFRDQPSLPLPRLKSLQILPMVNYLPLKSLQIRPMVLSLLHQPFQAHHPFLHHPNQPVPPLIQRNPIHRSHRHHLEVPTQLHPPPTFHLLFPPPPPHHHPMLLPTIVAMVRSRVHHITRNPMSPMFSISGRHYQFPRSGRCSMCFLSPSSVDHSSFSSGHPSSSSSRYSSSSRSPFPRSSGYRTCIIRTFLNRNQNTVSFWP